MLAAFPLSLSSSLRAQCRTGGRKGARNGKEATSQAERRDRRAGRAPSLPGRGREVAGQAVNSEAYDFLHQIPELHDYVSVHWGKYRSVQLLLFVKHSLLHYRAFFTALCIASVYTLNSWLVCVFPLKFHNLSNRCYVVCVCVCVCVCR